MKSTGAEAFHLGSRKNSRFLAMLAIAALIVVAAVTMLPAATGDTVADGVLGQSDFVHESSNTADAASLNTPNFVAIDRSATPNRLYVADTSNNRVLGWSNAASFANHAAADLVIGQPDFNSTVGNVLGPASSPTASNLASPVGVAVDSHGNLCCRYRQQPGTRVQQSV